MATGEPAGMMERRGEERKANGWWIWTRERRGWGMQHSHSGRFTTKPTTTPSLLEQRCGKAKGGRIGSWTGWRGQARTKEMGRESKQRSWKAGRDGDCCRCTSVFPLSHVHTSTLSSHYSPHQAWLPWLLQQYSTSDETARREKRVDPAHVQATTGYYSTSDESRGTEEPQREDEPRSRSVRELNERAAARRL